MEGRSDRVRDHIFAHILSPFPLTSFVLFLHLKDSRRDGATDGNRDEEMVTRK